MMMTYNTSDWPALPPMSALVNQVHCCDALEFVKLLPDNSVDCCVTSPAYFGLRNYGIAGQYGLEETPALYVQTLVTLFKEFRRVLKDEGTLWMNLGDSYVGATSNYDSTGSHGANSIIATGTHEAVAKGEGRATRNRAMQQNGLAMKNLIGIPWRVAFALQDDGWILRSDIIWSKPNPMPESVTDRPTKSHEYVFLFAKSSRYYYDQEAIKEPARDWGTRDRTNGKYHNEGTGLQPHSGLKGNRKVFRGGGTYTQNGAFNNHEPKPNAVQGNDGIANEYRNRRTVWTIATEANAFAHFATYPAKLIEPMILAGCPRGGVVFDPFMGSGTTAIVARSLGRNYLGSELNPEYVELAKSRLAGIFTVDMFDMPAKRSVKQLEASLS